MQPELGEAQEPEPEQKPARRGVPRGYTHDAGYARDDGRLTARQLRVLAALAAGLTEERAAALGKCTTAAIHRWRKWPAFAQELDRLLVQQRDRVQAMLGTLAQEAEAILRAAQGATTDDGAPAHNIRLRAAEAVLSNFVRISQRAAEASAPPSGPLIVLPPGTQRMALAVETAPSQPHQAPSQAGRPPASGAARQPRPALPSDGEVIEVEVEGVQPSQPQQPKLEPPSQPQAPLAPAGLPRWWKPMTAPRRPAGGSKPAGAPAAGSRGLGHAPAIGIGVRRDP
jgi:hypothetical protein